VKPLKAAEQNAICCYNSKFFYFWTSIEDWNYSRYLKPWSFAACIIIWLSIFIFIRFHSMVSCSEEGLFFSSFFFRQ
jgi:hypothetical protein